MKTILAVAMATCVLAGRVSAGDMDATRTAAELKRLLEEYDAAGGGNTIPIEQALVQLRDLKAARELEGVLGHRRFGFAAAWALSDVGDPASAPAILAAFKAAKTNGRIEMALSVGAFRTEEVRAALRTAVENSGGPERDAYRAALLRSGDPDVEKETLARLADKDASACSEALLTIGESRREDLLGRVAELAKDTRPVPGSRKSKFGVRTVTKRGDMTTTTTAYPVLEKVGDYAIEAASRAVSPTTPEMTAWWYEVEVAPRFSPTPEGIAFLGAYVEASKAAAQAKAPTAREAVTAVTRWLKASNEDAKAQITGVAFQQTWVVTYGLVEGMDQKPGPAMSATVDEEGRVTLK